jgi:uncharacterized protein (DUF433 family)
MSPLAYVRLFVSGVVYYHGERDWEDTMIRDTDIVSAVVRTESGLMIAGTRITLYDVMDYLVAGWPPHLLHHQLPLTPDQMRTALIYIDAHRTDVEAEYATIVAEAQQNRQHWEARNQERFAKIAAMPAPAGQEALREKLRAWHATHGPTQ